MSPVSRGRKTKPKTKAKKTKRRAAGRPGTAHRGAGDLLGDAAPWPFAALQSLMAPRQRPQWFDESIKAILDRAGDVMAAQGPRELEQATAELVGAELYAIVHDERHGMWFEWLFEDLVDGAAARVREEAERQDGRWEAPWRLLHGLTSIGSPALRSIAQSALARAANGLPAGAAARQPEWLRQLPLIAATGEVWEMHDAYGSRIALIAGFCYPGGTDPSVFLFDIDACGLVTLASAGVFDDVEQAATAWRALVGEVGDGARPSPVETSDRLVCLGHWDDGEESLSGNESRAVMDNWFRARRRHHDLAAALRKRGTPLPHAKSLYHDIDIAPMAEAFTDWYARRHGTKPDPDVVDAVAYEWCEGTLPGTWHAASPHRAQFQLDLISDWIPDPVTVGAKTLLPEWVRWNGEHSGLPEHLIERAVAVASGGPRSPAEGAADSL